MKVVRSHCVRHLLCNFSLFQLILQLLRSRSKSSCIIKCQPYNSHSMGRQTALFATLKGMDVEVL